MKRRLILGSLLVVLVVSILLPLGPAGARIALRLQANEPLHVGPVKDLAELLNYPYDVHIQDLVGSERESVVTTLMARPEAVQLRMAMAEKGFFADLANAEAMQIMVTVPDGTTRTLEAAVVPMGPGLRVFLPLVIKNYPGGAGPLLPTEPADEAPMALRPEELSAYLVAMVAVDGTTTFFQAHHTNLDPELAEVPDPPITYNGIPYFYITTLRVVDGRIVYWRYWWFDSHHHPNWYFACYQHYWDYYDRTGAGWPGWHQWVYGWYYWRFWYFWSTWFPWVTPITK